MHTLLSLKNMQIVSYLEIKIYLLTRAPLGYLTERIPLGEGGGILPHCLTRERVTVARWARRQMKALDDHF